jgi:hypothetical protein
MSNTRSGLSEKFGGERSMRFRNSLLIALLALSLPALADITTIVRAVETSTLNLTVPPASNGVLSFKPCTDGCEKTIKVRLTPETSYVSSGVVMSFADFRGEFNKMWRGGEHYALVSYDTRKSTVRSLEIQK